MASIENQNLNPSHLGRSHWAKQVVKNPVVLVASTISRLAKIAFNLVSAFCALILTLPCFCVSPYFYSSLVSNTYKIGKEIMGMGADVLYFVQREPVHFYRMLFPPPALVKHA